jgi:Secretion system C-terminal sorting domain
MSKFFTLAVLLCMAITTSAQTCFQENFNVQTTGWTYSQGASEGIYDNPSDGCSSGNNTDDRGIITPGVGGNNPANIITPNIVSVGGNTIILSFDIFVVDANLKCNTWKDYPCPTSIDVFYHVGATVYTGIIDLVLPPNGPANATNISVTFNTGTNLPAGTNYKVELAFKPKSGTGNCVQTSTKYVIDNFKTCEFIFPCVPGAPDCRIDGNDDNFCLQNPVGEVFSGDVSLNDTKYTGAVVTYSLASGPFANGNITPGGATLELNSNGTFNITRTDLTKSVFVFTYRVCDQNNQCDLASVQVCFPVGGPLPVVLSNFSAIRKGNTAVLNWQTQTEINAKSFEVEILSGNTYTRVASVAATSNPSGSNYSFIDNNTAKSTSLYRLKMIDRDNSFRYSEVRSIKGLAAVSDFSIYPNPSSGSAKVIINDVTEGMQVQLMDNTGRTIKTITLKNSNTVELNGLQRGMYLVKVINQVSNESVVKKLTVN